MERIRRAFFCLCLLPALVDGNGGNPPGKRCYHAYERCPLEELLKSYFPNDPNPERELSFRDAHNRGPYKFPQLATRIDNNVSDFSWDKVLFVGGLVYKPGLVWYPNYDVSGFKEDSHFTTIKPEKGHYIATTAHYPYQRNPKNQGDSPHDHNAALWLIVKTQGAPVPTSWLKEPGKHKNKRYMAHLVYAWRRRPPNCRALGGPMRTKAKPDDSECVSHGLPKSKNLRDDEGEFRWQGSSGNLWNAMGFNHDNRIPPMQGFIPKGGEVVGFMLTGYHAKMGGHPSFEGERPSIEARSNIVWYRLPSKDGRIKGAVVGCWSSADRPCVNGQRGTNFQGRAVAASTEPTSEPASPSLPSTTAKMPTSTPAATAAQPAATDCKTLRTQIPALQHRLDEQMKAYRGKRQKKWLGLKRNSCKNVRLCETLAGAIHLAASNPSMASRLGHYKKQFGKNCKDFERCRAITGEIEQIRKDLDASVRAYNKNCRS